MNVMSSFFLPIGLMISIVAAIALPELGLHAHALGLSPWLIATIFLVNGRQIDLSQRPKMSEILFTTSVLAVISLGVGPLLGVSVGDVLGLTDTMMLGLIVMSAMPPTFASAIVLTRIADGDPLRAILFTILLNLVGIFIIPFSISTLSSMTGDLNINPWNMIQNLLFLVLLPFTLGQVARLILPKLSAPKIEAYLPSVSIMVIVWMTLSRSSATMSSLSVQDFALGAIAVTIVHMALFVICHRTAKSLLHLPGSVVSAFAFTGSQKTLPVALVVLSTLPFGTGKAILICVMFHFIQLLIDSAIAYRWQKNPVAP